MPSHDFAKYVIRILLLSLVFLLFNSLVTIVNEGPRIDRRGLEWWA